MTLDGWSIDTEPNARVTLGRMGALARRALADPRVIHAANLVISDVSPRNIESQLGAISDYMDERFYFVQNPIGTQTIRPPGWTRDLRAPGMLQDIAARGITQGACDDAAVLIATIGIANGIPARFRAIAFCTRPGDCDAHAPYSHVICDLFDGTAWRDLDVTRPRDLARPTDDEIARTMLYQI